MRFFGDMNGYIMMDFDHPFEFNDGCSSLNGSRAMKMFHGPCIDHDLNSYIFDGCVTTDIDMNWGNKSPKPPKL